MRVPESVQPYVMKALDGVGVYVGTYRKYNNGSLYGAWIDLEECGDEDTFRQVCRDLHSDEKDPEFMYQDYQCFPSKFYYESGLDLEGIFEWLEYDETQRDIIKAYWSDNDESADADTILERYVGKDIDLEDLAREEVEEFFGRDLPSYILNNIDYEGVAKDLYCDYHVCGDGYLFDDNRA